MNQIAKFIRIIIRRLRTQGLRVTLIWVYARLIPRITGIPMRRYSEITPQVFVGAQYQRAGKRRLEEWGIDSVVNLRSEFDDAAHGLTLSHYLHLPTPDDHPPSLDLLRQGTKFIHEAVTRGGKVYIHCAGGVGRAPTMAVAYFISQGMVSQDAITLIKKGRPFIDILPEQLERLNEFYLDQLAHQ